MRNGRYWYVDAAHYTRGRTRRLTAVHTGAMHDDLIAARDEALALREADIIAHNGRTWSEIRVVCLEIPSGASEIVFVAK